MNEFFLCLVFVVTCTSGVETGTGGDLTTVHVLICIDDRWGGVVAVFLVSMFENANRNTFYHIHIQIPGNFKPEIKAKIGSIKDKYENCKIDFIDMGSTFHDISGKFPFSANFYLLAAGLFPEIKKLLYLDADMIVRHDLSQLYGTNIEEYYFAGVLDPVVIFEEEVKEFRRKIVKTPDLKQYINGGVTLLNLEKIRKDKLEAQFLMFMEEEKESIKKQLMYNPQDILNHVCYGKILLLPYKFHANVNLINFSEPYEKSAYAKLSTYKDWEEAKDATIIHFTSTPKPWKRSRRKGIYHEEWWMYARKTAFYDEILKENGHSSRHHSRTPKITSTISGAKHDL